jgi:tetrathionate reductase subunit A
MAKENNQSNHISRRGFLRSTAFIGGCAALAGKMAKADGLSAGNLSQDQFYELAKAENIIYTACMNCNTGCSIKAKIIDGVVAKIDGNPFSPWTMTPHINYDNDPTDASIARLDGAICPKGQAGIQILYDPYRIRKVLKRTGKRGEGKWKSMPFEQAIAEIVNGGRIFQHVPGEENRTVEGLDAICAMRDPNLMKSMKSDADAIVGGKMSVAEFKIKHAEHLHVLIDPDHPDLGPKNNQLVFNWGRMKGGRSDFVKRFFNGSFGTVNTHGHTTVCQGSLYFACKAMSEQYMDGKWTGGKKFYWQADLKNAEFVIFVGSNVFEGGYGPPLRTSKITNGLTERRLRFAVVDPRMGKLGAKAWKWLPAQPGSEAALALAMIQWIIANNRYDNNYLSAANKAAAIKANEPNWSNAAWLVKIDKDGTSRGFLRVAELPANNRPKGNADQFVVMNNGKLVALTPDDADNAATGELLVDTTVGGVHVKSSMQLLYESSLENTIEGWAKICGLKSKDIVQLADEFTSHGKKGVADIHRGVSQHTNGYSNVSAWMCLNLLNGNIGWKGGMSQPSTYDAAGAKTGQPFPIDAMHPNKLSAFGLSVIRHDAKYEKSTIFNDYPAKRPWFPLASDVYQEVIPSIGDAYPYPVKALILYNGAPNYSLPAGDKLNAILSNTEKLPLFISNDITIGATSAFADYIFPDGTYLERWEFHGSHPNVTQKVQPVRNPVVTPLVDTCTVFGEEMPMTFEALMMGIAEKMNLSGFGEDGFANGLPFKHPDHFYLKMVANTANDGKAVPDADDKELDVFIKSRRHLAGHTFNEQRWKESVGSDWWKKVVYVMNRGGRFQDYKNTYKNNHLANAYNAQINMYCEKTALTRNSMTGKYFSGIPIHNPVLDALGQPVNDSEKGYNLQLSTYRQSTQTKSRTNVSTWLLAISPENSILINRITAEELGLRNDDLARITSACNPEGKWDLGLLGQKDVVGKVKVVEGILPGVISFSLGFGQWGNGAKSFEIDGKILKGDERRGKGIHANAVMSVDPYLKNTTLTDPIGASAVFYDTKVKLIKV